MRKFLLGLAMLAIPSMVMSQTAPIDIYARTLAITANNTANAASTTANGINAQVQTANTNASNAVTTANNASTTANGIADTANNANTNASNAVSTANTASTNATTALGRVRTTTDANGYESWYIGTGAGLNANITTPAKTMYLCLGWKTCGGEGTGYNPGNVNAETSCAGWAACSHLTTGIYNSVFGVGSLRNETTGTGNLALGVDVMAYGVGNNSSIGIGNSAFGSGIHTNSIAIGTAAGGYASQTTTFNSTILMGSNNTGGTGTTAVTTMISIGNANLSSNTVTSPGNQVLLGHSILSGGAVTNPTQNFILGNSVMAGGAVTNPVQDVFFGSGIYNNANVTTASYATVMGFNACSTCYGNGNAIFGYNAGSGMTSGGSNTILGPSVGTTTLKTGFNNFLAGTDNTVDTVTAASNKYVNIMNVFMGYAIKPTANSGFGTSPTVTGTGTAAFKIVIGTGGSATTLAVGFAQAPNGWVCAAADESNTLVTLRQSFDNATSVQFTANMALAANDNVVFKCLAY